ncbi:hypothetical protein HNQ77_001111 [Silvibacterium bohemicum]|uniref:Uncharacterized protein n=1 Tax=Silvibacterium bohemicum TaxID=1577686 RepID=A0A841JRL8_9BACT|nr:hypothetical protein [Silvibacterium bohemicum]MBB6143167.1 hypothetical protein [Silvibacterium bohemicum]
MDDINVILADHPGLGRVRLCECNSIHLSIGPVTVNLAPDVFAQTAILIRNAMEQLDEILGALPAGQNPLQPEQPNPSRFTH